MLSVNILYKKNGLFTEWYKNGTDWYSVPGERNVPKWYYFIRGILFFQLNSCPSGRLSIATLPTTVTQKIKTLSQQLRVSFDTTSTFTEIRLFPPVEQSHVGWMRYVHVTPINKWLLRSPQSIRIPEIVERIRQASWPSWSPNLFMCDCGKIQEHLCWA